MSEEFKKNNPSNPVSFEIPAFVYLQEKEYDKALENINKALKLDPNREIAIGIKNDILKRM